MAHLQSLGNGLANVLALFQRTPQLSWQSSFCAIGRACLCFAGQRLTHVKQ